MSEPLWDRLWVNVNLATMTGDGLGRVNAGGLATTGDRISWVGALDELPGAPEMLAREVIRGSGEWLLPGFIDCHTHIVFGGDRSDEFRRRLHGATYEEIAANGGGIMSTVRATRGASDGELLDGALRRARELCAWGVTTLEVKSGYGLDLESELRMLRVAAEVSTQISADVHLTLLAAHAVPPEYEGRSGEYVDLVVDQIVPRAVETGLVQGIDAFCERMAFSVDESRRVLAAGIKSGLVGRLHADQRSDCGGGALAAEVGARSADHLEYLSAEGVEAMAEAGVSAVLLPGAFYSLRESQAPPVSLLRSNGVDMAVASDANPGSSPITHFGVILNMACVLFGLTPEETLRGATVVPARVLGVEADRGTLAPGMRADFALWSVPDPVWLTYWVGAAPLAGVVKDGVPVAPG